MTVEITVPTLGESVTEAIVGKWHKEVGEKVNTDELIVELETDKVTLEINAPATGTLDSQEALEGATVSPGGILGRVQEGQAGAETGPEQNQPTNMIDVPVPTLGESVTEAIVGEWQVGPGDNVAADAVIVELETDKVALEVTSPTDGIVSAILVQSGDTATPGAVLAQINALKGAMLSQAEAVNKTGAPDATASADSRPPSPSAQKLLRENPQIVTPLQGSGKHGQVLKHDVQAAMAAPLDAAPDVASTSLPQPKLPDPPGPQATTRAIGESDHPRERRVRMSRLRRTIAHRLKDAQNVAAMLTTFNDVDMSAVMALRKEYRDSFEKRHGTRLGFLGFFSKAVVHALKDIPAVNAEIDGEDILYKDYYNIGIAVGTDKGLVVPVVRDADQLSIAGIEAAIANHGRNAREGKLSIDDMQGGTFTITNGGVYGSMLSTPILNAPQSGILGLHRIEERPVAHQGQVVIRPMMYLALTYDHRIVDGKEAVTFLVRIKEAIEDPRRLVIDV